jgi:ABC-type transport system substrate-binding protein
MQLPMIPNPIHVAKNFLLSTAVYAPDTKRPAGFDELVNKLLMAKDLKSQKDIFKKINRMVMDEVMYIPINVEPRIVAFHKSIRGYENFNDYTGPWVPRMSDMWISKK